MYVASFSDATRSLLENARERVRSGELSERRLARLIGVSQPHMHNILAGKRALTPEVADRVLEALGISLASLEGAPSRGEPAAALAPWLAGPLGGGRAFPGEAAEPLARFFRQEILAGLFSPYLGRVAEQETGMQPTLLPGDDLLLECGGAGLRRLRPSRIYAIEWRGKSYLCRCRSDGDAMALWTDSETAFPPPKRIALGRRKLEEVVRGEVVWHGRVLSFERGSGARAG